MFVNEPSFSTCDAAGRKNTSVGICPVTSSPVSISGPSSQNVADSISTRSRTTSQSSLAIASRCSFACAEPTAGFSPARMNPLTEPSNMSNTHL